MRRQHADNMLVYVGVVVLVAAAVSLMLLAGYIESKLEESGEAQVMSHTEQMASFMGESVNTIEMAIGSYSVETTDSATLYPSLVLFRDRFGFTKVGFADMSGVGINAEGLVFTIDELTPEETALSQGREGYGYSETYRNENGEFVRLAQRPLFIGEEQVGALYVQVPLRLFMPTYYTQGDAGESEAYLFDGETGEVLVSSAGEDSLVVPGDSMYEFIAASLSSERVARSASDAGSGARAGDVAEVAHAVSAGESYLVVGQVNGVASYICLAPTGKGSWYACDITSVSAVRAEAHLVKAVFSAVFALGVFCVLLAVTVAIFLFRRQMRERDVKMRRRLYEALSDSLDMAVMLYSPSDGEMTPIVAKDEKVLGASFKSLLWFPSERRRLGLSESGESLFAGIKEGRPTTQSPLYDEEGIGRLSTGGMSEDGCGTVQGEFSLVGKTAHGRRYVEYAVRPLSFEGKRQLLVILRDVTEERMLQLSMKSAMETAESANRAKSSFLSRMSHEIRTPMNVIVGMLAIARKNVHNPLKLEQNLEHIEHASKHLLDLINEVLDISKIESGKMGFDDAPFCLMDVVDSMEEVIKPQCAERGLSYSFEPCGPVGGVFLGDEVRVRQMLVNLLTNAVKYTEPGGRVSLSVTVEPSLATGYHRITFVVADNGIGMDPEFLDRLFEPFAMEGRSVSEGTGLGMPIVKNIVSSMGGDIHVESQKGRGTVVTVVVNKRMLDDGERSDRLSGVLGEAKTAEDAEAAGCAEAYERDIAEMGSQEVSADADAPPPHGDRLAGVRVLLVEDSDLNAEIAAELLADAGLVVEWARDGAVACDMFAASDVGYYDVVLMDVRMPNMDGHEATRTIRAMDREDAAKVPIIAMSANAFADDVLASFKSGMNAHLSKPVDMAELLDTIDSNLVRQSLD